MKQMETGKKSGKYIFIIGLILLVQTSFVFAAEDIVGNWQITMDFNGRQMMATLTITKSEDGTLAGKWGSGDLSNVKFEDGKLTFQRTTRMRDEDMTSDFSGTLKDGTITGTMSNDFADMDVKAVRKKPKCPALGQWDFKFSVGDMDIEAKLIVSQTKEGKLEGKWTETIGEHSVSDVKFEDGKLTFTRKSKIEDMEFESTYEGTVKGDELVGTLKSEMGDIQINGKRFGTALIGTWELTTTSDFGTRTSMLVVDPDMTGTYETFGGEVPVKDLKLDGDQVTFGIEMGFGDRTFKMDFKGKMEDKTIKGQMTSDRGTDEVSGKKVEKKAPAPEAAPAPAN